MNTYLGIDIGSVTTKLALIDENGSLIKGLYLRTQGQPTKVLQTGLSKIKEAIDETVSIKAVGTTGSGRYLAGVVAGADVIKNEITAHAVAASHVVPGVQTIIEIGGQDSKIIILRDGVPVDFAMNTVCAAGTGSFLDHQAARLNINIEDFGETALKARNPVRIAGRCAVFAETDMIHKQQVGHNLPDILAGLCEAMVRNYLNNVGKGKDIKPPVVFQGGVAANIAIKQAFEKALGLQVLVPDHFGIMGAIGAALIARDTIGENQTKFRGFEVANFQFASTSWECQGCPNLCEIVTLKLNGKTVARWGDRCGKWQGNVQDISA
ncbi:MAG: 2-hydroxyglutaryl-CoA dehydratase [Firmicutes bacterium]|nr:2-hydroxyglutaryl-CoA dehydratase [Bacillota bacterium]